MTRILVIGNMIDSGTGADAAWAHTPYGFSYDITHRAAGNVISGLRPTSYGKEGMVQIDPLGDAGGWNRTGLTSSQR